VSEPQASERVFNRAPCQVPRHGRRDSLEN
jgi:hypothetical protein